MIRFTSNSTTISTSSRSKLYAGITLLLLLFALLFTATETLAMKPFPDEPGVMFEIREINKDKNGIYKVNLKTLAGTLIFTVVRDKHLGTYGPIALNPVDRYLYYLEADPIRIIKIGSDFTSDVLTRLNTPNVQNVVPRSMSFDKLGNLFIVTYHIPEIFIFRINYADLKDDWRWQLLDTTGIESTLPNGYWSSPGFVITKDGTIGYGHDFMTNMLVIYKFSGNRVTGELKAVAGLPETSFFYTLLDNRGNLFLISPDKGPIYMLNPEHENPVARIILTRTIPFQTVYGPVAINPATTMFAAQPAFDCTRGTGYILQNIVECRAKYAQNIYKVNLETHSYDLVALDITSRVESFNALTALAFNPKDKRMWAKRMGSPQLARIGSDWSVSFHTTNEPWNPNKCGPSPGDIDRNGIFYVVDIPADQEAERYLYKTDLDPASPGYLTTQAPLKLTGYLNLTGLRDIAVIKENSTYATGLGCRISLNN